MTEKTCFIISPIGKEDSEIRDWCDNVYDFIIKPVLVECGYKAIRPHEIGKSGIITDQIIDLLYNADLVIADLTNNNPNVTYELAIRHITEKPCIEIMEPGDTKLEIPFDISSMRVILYNSKNLKSVDNLKKSLKNHIESINSIDYKISNPVKSATTSLHIKQKLEKGATTSDVPENKIIIEAISELRNLVLDLKEDSIKIKTVSFNSAYNDDVFHSQNLLTSYMDQRLKLNSRINELKNHLSYLQNNYTKSLEPGEKYVLDEKMQGIEKDIKKCKSDINNIDNNISEIKYKYQI